MWVDDEIWTHASFGREGEIDVCPHSGQNAFLTSPRCKFVADDWSPVYSQTNVGAGQRCFVVADDGDLCR